MSLNGNLAEFLAKLINTLQEESLKWQEQNQADLLMLNKEEIIAAEKIRQELLRMKAQFEGELERLQILETYRNEMFKDFLDSIDESKRQFIEHYPNMSRAMAIMICNHATELLSEAFNNSNIHERQKKESMYLQFMTCVCEELTETVENKSLPERTLELLKIK